MERVGNRKGQMETCCLTGQSPQRAVAPMEEEEEYINKICAKISLKKTVADGEPVATKYCAATSHVLL